jgi:hypothetical protein
MKMKRIRQILETYSAQCLDILVKIWDRNKIFDIEEITNK